MDTLIYLRRSVVDEDNPGFVSHKDQMTRCQDLARQHGSATPIVLEDWGRSGGEGLEHRRGGYQRLKDAIAGGGVRWVISYDLSRLSRSTRETLELVEHAQRHGARIHVGDLGVLDPDNPAATFTMTTMAAVNKMYRDNLSKRSREAAMRRKAEGLPVGRPPYGDLPGEDAQRVIAAYHRAGSFLKAAQLLNDEPPETRLRTRSGAEWGSTQVHRVVRRVEPASVATQKGIRSKGRNPLTGLCWCWCGGRMQSHGGTWGDQLVCARGKALPPDKHPRPVYVQVGLVLPWVKEEAARLRLPDAVRTQVADDEDERTRLLAKRERVVDMYADGTITSKADRDRRLADIDAEMAHLAVRREVIDVPEIDWTWAPGDINAVLRTIFERIDMEIVERPAKEKGRPPIRSLSPRSAVWNVPEWRA